MDGRGDRVELEAEHSMLMIVMTGILRYPYHCAVGLMPAPD
jgi:hypothetical protein